MQLPPYLVALNLSTLPVDYQWDSDVFDSFWAVTDEDHPRLAGALLEISVRASFSLAIACSEWVVARVTGHVDTGDALARIEAAWAATLDRRYANLPAPPQSPPAAPYEFASPLRLAMKLISHAHSNLSEAPLEVRPNAQGLAMEVDHIAGRHPAYEPWLSESLRRARERFPAGDRAVEEEALVPKSFYEPGFVWQEDAAHESLVAFVRGLDPARNSYLRSPEEMQADGFSGAPYGRDLAG